MKFFLNGDWNFEKLPKLKLWEKSFLKRNFENKLKNLKFKRMRIEILKKFRKLQF